MRTTLCSLLLAAGVLLQLAACDGSSSPAAPQPPVGEAVMPAFALEDLTPGSPRFGQLVSPRDYIGTVSAWYFGHST